MPHIAKRRISIEGPDSSAAHPFLITPADGGDELPFVTRQIDVLVPGTLAVVLEDGTNLILPAAAGSWSFPIRVRRVKSTGTGASSLVGYP